VNFADIQNDLYRRLKFATTPDATVITRLNAFINEAHREVLGMKGYQLLRRNQMTFACIANNGFVSLPEAIDRIVTIQDRVNQILLDQVDVQEIRYNDPGLTQTTQFPYQYAVMDYAAAVAQDPSAASQIWAKSDSASDGSATTVYIEGTVTGGYYQTASHTLNGTTAVQLGALGTWVTITKFYISATAGGSVQASGNILLLKGSGSGTELARIPPGYNYARYVRLMLWPVPSQINTYYADVELHVEDMANGGDQPLIPEDFHWLLISRAMMAEYEYKERLDLYSAENAKWRNGLGDLRMYLVRRSGVAVGLQRRRRWSQLGPYYPVGS